MHSLGVCFAGHFLEFGMDDWAYDEMLLHICVAYATVVAKLMIFFLF
jgi:hypothetical protein